jgi:uncharacterized protein YndB with AHSA1/START domain
VDDSDTTRTSSSPVVAVVQRVLPAVPDTIYDEWLDTEALSDWMCPRPARCLDVKLEPWVGGSLRFDIEESGVEFFVAGRFTVLERPRRLTFTWRCSTWPVAAAESVVDISLDPCGHDQTLMTIEHTLLPSGLVEQHRRGWAAIAEQLDAGLNRRGSSKATQYDWTVHPGERSRGET